MTRHFLRDENGEEYECLPFDAQWRHMYRAYTDQPGWELLIFKKEDIYINGKLEFAVWHEI